MALEGLLELLVLQDFGVPDSDSCVFCGEVKYIVLFPVGASPLCTQ